MNIFRFAGDMSHLISVLILLLKIYATKSCAARRRNNRILL
ncbi:putative ER lumen protein retaining receptor [Arabidopsis thaliana]